MNIANFIARKVAFSGNRVFASFIIRLAVITVSLSLAVMILTTAVITGFKREISSKVFGFWGHIHITDPNASRTFEPIPVSKNQDFYPGIEEIRQIETEYPFRIFNYEFEDRYITKRSRGGIRKIQVFINQAGILTNEDQFEGIILKGVDHHFDWKFLNDYLQEGETLELDSIEESNQILISQITADRMKLEVGDRIIIHFMVDNLPRRSRFEVKGIFKTGLSQYDQKFALVDIKRLQRMLKWNKDLVGGFEVLVEDIRDLEVINEYLFTSGELPYNLYSESVRSKYSSIFSWLELQDINERVIIMLMAIVSIINMITVLLILILERTQMIGILKALGAGNWTIRRVFLYYAYYIIRRGLIIGNSVGIGLALIQKQFKIIKLPEADYYLTEAPIHLELIPILLINAGIIAVILISLVIPTQLISRIRPVKALHFK